MKTVLSVKPACIQVIEQPSHALIHRRDATEIVLDVALILPAEDLVVAQFARLHPRDEGLIFRLVVSIPGCSLCGRHPIVFAIGINLAKMGGKRAISMKLHVVSPVQMTADRHFVFFQQGGPFGVVVAERRGLGNRFVGE